MDAIDQIAELMPILPLQTNNTIGLVSLRAPIPLFRVKNGPRTIKLWSNSLGVKKHYFGKKYFGAQLCDRRNIVF